MEGEKGKSPREGRVEASCILINQKKNGTKVLLITFKAIHGLALHYISDLIAIKEAMRYSLPSDSTFLWCCLLCCTRLFSM